MQCDNRGLAKRSVYIALYKAEGFDSVVCKRNLCNSLDLWRLPSNNNKQHTHTQTTNYLLGLKYLLYYANPLLGGPLTFPLWRVYSLSSWILPI